MYYGTMLVKNLVGRLGVHDKMDHTLEVRSLSLGEIIGRLVRVTLFARTLQPYRIIIGLKEHLNRVYLPPRPTLQRVRQGLSLLIQVHIKYFNMHTL